MATPGCSTSCHTLSLRDARPIGAAEVRVAGDGRAAYWWARAAIHAAPEYAAAYNTLGVIYLRHGDAQLAEGMFRFELARTPQDPTLLSNLVVALDRQGRSGDAAREIGRASCRERVCQYV